MYATLADTGLDLGQSWILIILPELINPHSVREVSVVPEACLQNLV